MPAKRSGRHSILWSFMEGNMERKTTGSPWRGRSLVLGKLGMGLVLGSLAMWALGSIGPESALAQTVFPRSKDSLMTLFRKVTLTPGFDPDPFELSGISGGTIAAATIADRLETETGICWGYVSEIPDYELVLTDDFTYLNLEVFSAQDTMILVQGPGGTWCSDDIDGWNPSIAGQWLAGTYRVWVGSGTIEQYSPYDLSFSEVR
jgi:hypothetical protein